MTDKINILILVLQNDCSYIYWKDFIKLALMLLACKLM